jgi:hypothetical protein
LRNCPKQSLKEGRKEDPGNPSKTLAIPGDFAMLEFIEFSQISGMEK